MAESSTAAAARKKGADREAPAAANRERIFSVADVTGEFISNNPYEERV
jgi:hypothetical protein